MNLEPRPVLRTKGFLDFGGCGCCLLLLPLALVGAIVRLVEQAFSARKTKPNAENNDAPPDSNFTPREL